ncbi:hypothetical protein [Leptolyngbya sp. FACHB-16]|uniref:hypothetical protein n=1 Tax=unclassified Leptolyngbya TaxID=2650499 RepID=UPI00168A08E3|nr:hypothetical protein [Leptolyngbya sp. FACHB-16]MBD2153130.1 hypothetical protein [Leptolyngbya sp. FACHB-16]
MNQLSLIQIERKTTQVRPGCCHIPNWLSLREQQKLLALLREWCAGSFWAPKMPNGTSTNQPLCGLSLNWKPHEYVETTHPSPLRLQFLVNRVLGETLPQYQHSTLPDVAIVNYAPSPAVDIEMRSRSVVVMGSHSRMAFHGITKIVLDSAPLELGMKIDRLSIPVRQARRGVA